MQTNWDYSERAHTYDKRADYDYSAIKELLAFISLPKSSIVADMGAGTGKLTKFLATFFDQIYAVEPNDMMRFYGSRNVNMSNVHWLEGSAESSNLSESSVDAVFFGSSFNVVNIDLTVPELRRIVKQGGWFACMWNHRDTKEFYQREIERLIHSFIPEYDYGTRRQDPTPVLASSGLFTTIHSIEKRFEVKMEKVDIVEAWRSHDTLFRQSGTRFQEIIASIADLIPHEGLAVPYFTRIWMAKFKN